VYRELVIRRPRRQKIFEEIAAKRLAETRSRAYGELLGMIGDPQSEEVIVEGQMLQVEIDVMQDDPSSVSDEPDLRIVVAVSDGGLSSLLPVARSDVRHGGNSAH